MTNIRNNAYKWLSYVIVICIMLQTAGVVRAEGDMQSDTYTLDFETTYSDASGNAYYSDNAENWSAANGSGSHAEMITENSNTAVRLTYDNERGNYNENAVMNIYNPETKNKFSGTAGVTYTITFDYKVEETDGKELQLFVAPSNREKGYPGQNAFTTTDMGPKAVILPAPAAGTPFIAASGTITQKTEGYVRASVQYTAQNAVSGHTVYPIIVLQTNNKTKDETHTGDRPYASVLIDNIEIKVPQSKSVICYNYDGGDKTLKVYDNTTFAELEVPSRAGYVFGGWYTNEALTNKAETDELVFDYDAIYARWVGGGEAKTPSQITDYFNTSWSRRFKDLSMDISGLGEDVVFAENDLLESAGAETAAGTRGAFEASSETTVTNGSLVTINTDFSNQNVIFYVELSDYQKAGVDWGLGLGKNGVCITQAGKQVHTDFSSVSTFEYAEDDKWVKSAIAEDGGFTELPPGYRGYIRFDFSEFNYTDEVDFSKEFKVKSLQFKMNGFGADNGNIALGGIFYFPQTKSSSTIMKHQGKFYQLSKSSDAMVVNAYDVYEPSLSELSTRYSGTASQGTAKFTDAQAEGLWCNEPVGITTASENAETASGYMNTYIRKNADVLMQPGTDKFMIYVEMPKFKQSTTAAGLKMLDSVIKQGNTEKNLSFANSVYKYADVHDTNWKTARAGADGDLYAIPSGFKGYIQFDIKHFKNFADMNGIDFSDPYYISKLELGINHIGGENGSFVLGAVYSVISESNAPFMTNGVTAEKLRYMEDYSGTRGAMPRGIFTADTESENTPVVYPRQTVENQAAVIEADTALNSKDKAKRFAQEINDNKVGDFEKTGIDKMCHVSTFLYSKGNIYVSYYANAISASEDPQYQVARFAYAPEDAPENKTILDIMQVGDTLDGKMVVGVYDTILMQKENEPDNIYILWTANVAWRYYRLYRVFNTETGELGEIGVNRFKVGDVTNDFSATGMRSALTANNIGYKEFYSDIGIMQKLSTRTENGETYYYTGTYSGNFTCIIKSKDLITWEYVAQPNEGNNNTGFANDTKWENAVYVLDDIVYYFVRQWDEVENGSRYGILTSYNLISGEWAQPVLVGDCQSRSDFIYYNNGLYLFYAPTDREHIGILRINTDNLAQSEVVLQADMKGSCFYPFVQYNSDGELCMSYTVSRQHIRLASFNLGELVKEEIISGSISAEYSRIATERGFAEGIITITPSADSDAESYEIYWGNDSGILSDFTLLASVTANGTNSISFEINKEIMIPLDANKIYVYPKKGDTLGTAEVIEIDSSALGAYSKKKYSFQVISDLHSGNSDEFYQQAKIRAALEDIKKTEPDSSGIIINGDSVESNTDAYWEQLVKNLNASIAKDIPLYFTAGNCELEADADETYTQQINRYLKYTNQFSDVQADSVYYAHKINGQYFIHLGSQSQTENGYADLHQDQLDWLKGALKHADKEGVRAYVFIHQPLKNTVSGTFEAFNQNRYGVVQDSELRDILDKYSNVLVFSGHTHINLECVQPALLGGTEKPSYFNNASIGNMVKMSNADTMDYEGSQGLFVDVYNDKIIVRGRDFANKKWISAAQFVVYTGDAPEELSQLNAEFFDERGNKLIGFDSIASTDNAKVHISLPDEIKKNSEGVALVAFYDADGRYIKLCTEEITDFSKDIEFGMGKAVKETGGSVKVFMWDSLDSMKPLCKSAGV